MKEIEGETYYTGTLHGGPGDGVTGVELGYPPLPMIIKFEDNSVSPSRYCVYARKMDTTEYHHITGCCNPKMRGEKP